MEQLNQSFSGSTPRAGGDKLQKSGKSLLSALQLISISQIRTPKVLVRSFRPLNCKKISSNRRSSKELRIHSDQSEDFLRILKLHFYLILKNLIIFSNFSFDFINNYYRSNYFVVNNPLQQKDMKKSFKEKCLTRTYIRTSHMAWTLYFLYKLYKLIFLCIKFMSYDLFLYKFGLNIFTWGISSWLNLVPLISKFAMLRLSIFYQSVSSEGRPNCSTLK